MYTRWDKTKKPSLKSDYPVASNSTPRSNNAIKTLQFYDYENAYVLVHNFV